MKNWLNDAVVYEIYPQSFYDTNNDGIGDLQGIIQKLDYIRGLGFTAIWLNPVNKSSFRDGGYDVTDFYAVDERYGTNEDFKKLCDEAHKRGMKVVFDLVAGHTSIDHPWFKESCKYEENEYTNRYIWTNNMFEDGGGVGAIGEKYGGYIANFFWCQPSLNYGYAHPDKTKPWQLPVTHPDCIATKEELKKIMGFWIDLGTDGFRVDMAPSLIKGDFDGSFMKAFWEEMREYINTKNPECILIAEWGNPTDAINSGFDLDFYLHFGVPGYPSLFRGEDGRNTYKSTGHSYFNKDGKGTVNEYLDQILFDLENTKGKGYIGQITGNHDMPRMAYRRTAEELKTAYVFLFTMPGVPFVYYGDEIGMDYIENLPSKEGGGIRTGARTPMQWNSQKNHGFSDSDNPYLPTDNRENAPTVENQINDENSVLNFTKKLVEIHKSNRPLFADGEFNVIRAGYPFVYERIFDNEKIFVAINPSQYEYTCDIPEIGEILVSQNVKIEDKKLFMNGVSFIIAKEK